MSAAPAIIAAAEHEPVLREERGFVELHVQAGARALARAGIAPDELEGLLTVGPMMAEGPTFLSEDIMDYLGLTSLKLQAAMQLGGGSHLAMVRHACNVIAAGEAETILCVSAGKFPPIRDIGSKLMGMVAHPDWELPYGPSIPTLYGLIAQRWMHETAADKADLAEVVVAQDAWAKRHPTALSRDTPPVTVEEVLAGRPIAGPFSYLDCSIPCEGGGALVIASAERARRSPGRPVHVIGVGEGHTHGFLTSMRSQGRTGAARSGPMALDRAGRKVADVDVWELYDAFSSNPLMTLEEVGAAAPGRAATLFRTGRTGPGGDMPVNTNGGLLRFGHSGTASGLTGVLEAYWQLSGQALGEQVPNADCAFVHAYGSMLCSHVSVVLEGA